MTRGLMIALSVIIRILFLGFVLSITSCKTQPVINIDSNAAFQDSLYPDYHNVDIETENDVFSISQATMSFVDHKLSHISDPVKRIKTLADSIFDHTDLNLLYQNDANTVADETFKNGAANCLSLTIMTYALADYAGIGVRFQQVHVPELWTRREGVSVLNRHVNLRLYQKAETNVILYNNESFQLDFDQRIRSLQMSGEKIDKKRVLAMFYNNKGAEALINSHYTIAYAYFRKAIITDPLLIEALTNMGVLYSRSDRPDLAEGVYELALTINTRDSSTLENLANVYARTGRKQEANRILARIKELRKNNPYYHYILGEIEAEKKNWDGAIKHYRKAISLNKKQHHFHFALAKVYYQTGNLKLSRKYLRLAKKYTPTDKQQQLYQGKLDLLPEF